MKNTRLLFVLSIMAFLGNSLNGQAQNYLTQQSVQHFFYPQFSPINLDQGTDTIEQKALLKKICLLANHCDFCLSDSTKFDKTYLEYVSSHGKSIHFVDLDKDGDQDIIFNGKECPGMDEGLVEIYENQDDTLLLKFRSSGRLINFDFQNATFVIHDYPCCAQQTQYLIEYHFVAENFETTALRAHLLVGHLGILGGPYFPNSSELKLNLPFIAPQEIALRWSANLTDMDPTETCENAGTNRICHYPEGSSGTILFKKPDGWTFLRMDPNLFARNACEDNYSQVLKNLPIYYYGWVNLE
ncbi:MAG: hypothetical protein IT222_11180 [Crocinitomix sp.]|nr:hypothetical protein [Crocinitomix sp.]